MSTYDPFEETRRQVERVRRWAETRRRLAIAGGCAVLGVLAISTSYFQVEAEEVAVVLRFGKHIGTEEPGPHFRIPLVDQVIKLPVQRQMRHEFGFRTNHQSGGSESIYNTLTHDEARMLTAQRHVAIVEWIVQYIIEQPEKYVFNFRDVDATIRLMSEATMRSVVGDYTIDELITKSRATIELEAQEKLRELNRVYETGVRIENVKLKRVDVPKPVQQAFSEVEEAKQEKDRLINQAREKRNKIIPLAEGRKQQRVSEARGYATERINEATGDANRFIAVAEEYRKAKNVTKTRLYFESMSEILPKARRKVLVDDNMKGMLPLLNLQGPPAMTGAQP